MRHNNNTTRGLPCGGGSIGEIGSATASAFEGKLGVLLVKKDIHEIFSTSFSFLLLFLD